jgi:two-component system response regulator HydG
MAAILVAEDEHLTRWTVAKSLRMDSHKVDEARDGKTAIRLIESKSFDAVVSDYRMPGALTGLDVLKYYHQLFPEKPKVLLTGRANDYTLETLETIHAIYVPKPFLVEDLLGILDRLMHQRTHAAAH